MHPNFTNGEIIEIWAANAQESVSAFDDEGDFARKHLLNPAIFSMLEPVTGKIVMDAGCGNGYLSRLLAKRGAVVTGIEPALFNLCRGDEKNNENVTYLKEDLSLLLAGQPALAGAFDAVVSNVVLQDIPDVESAIRNCVRCLRKGGSIVLSILHPCFDDSSASWTETGIIAIAEYFAFRAIPQQKFGVRFHRSLSFYLNSLIENGCEIRRVLEPQLEHTLSLSRPEYRRDAHVPSFLVIHAVRTILPSNSSARD